MCLIRLEPAYQHYVWGGKRIPEYFHRSLPAGKYAESWEVSDRSEGMSKIASGSLRGKTFSEWLKAEKEKGVGIGKSWEKFPILVKIIDSSEHLSVQVHPDEKIAERLGGEPKSEAWIALEKSTVYVGFKEGVTQDQFVKARDTKHVESLLNQVVLEKGEGIYIPAGQIHAVCAGAFLLEVQQNSNTTYRVYDWGRIGRELHWEEAMAAIHWNSAQPLKIKPNFIQADGHHRTEGFVSTPYFTIDRLEIGDRWQIKSHKKTCQILFCMQGHPIIENEKAAPGMTYLVPATAPLISIEGASQWIVINL